MGDALQLVSEGAQLFKEGKLQEAIAKLKAAVEADASNVQAHSYLGAAYASKGEHPASIEQFQAALDLDPTRAIHSFNLGQAYENSGNKQRAQDFYKAALAIDPQYARAQQRLDALTSTPAPAPVTPPVATVSMPSAPPPAVTQIGQSYSPPPPSYSGGSQVGAPPTFGPDPSLGLGRKTLAYSDYSPSWKRFVAALLDGLILAIVILPVYFLAVVPAMSTLAPGGTANPQAAVIAMQAAMTKMQAFSAVLGILYYVGFNASLGATPGKMALGMKILKTDGSKIGIGTAIGRYLLQGLFAALTCQLAYIAILVDSENRGWHDKVMDTMVVDK